MDENICSYMLTPNPLIGLRTKIRAVLRIKVNKKKDCMFTLSSISIYLFI